MDQLEARWQDAFYRYDEFKRERESRVARWEWASGQRYDLRPLYFERNVLPRAKRLPAEPAEPGGKYVYGFDAEGKLVVARRYAIGMDYSQNPFTIALRGLKPVLQWSDQFLWHSESGTDAVTYTQFEPRMPVAVAFLRTDQARPVTYRSLEISIGPQIGKKKPGEVWDLVGRTGGALRQSEDYLYRDGNLVHVDVRLERGSDPPGSYVQDLAYDASGRLLEVTWTHPDGTVQVAYRRVMKGESLPVLAKRVGARLVQAIPESLRAAQLPGRAYCLVLIYHDRYAPPDLVVGMERDRDRLLAQGGAGARYMVFVPAGPSVEFRDSDPEAEYSLFEQQVRVTEGWEAGRDMLRGVASALARRDWAGILDVTPDFVVFAADYEAGDVAESIAASNPPRVVSELRAKGWL